MGNTNNWTRVYCRLILYSFCQLGTCCRQDRHRHATELKSKADGFQTSLTIEAYWTNREINLPPERMICFMSAACTVNSMVNCILPGYIAQLVKDLGNSLQYHNQSYCTSLKISRMCDIVPSVQAGNVVTGEMVEELILSGADIIKVGIGPGKSNPVKKG